MGEKTGSMNKNDFEKEYQKALEGTLGYQVDALRKAFVAFFEAVLEACRVIILYEKAIETLDKICKKKID